MEENKSVDLLNDDNLPDVLRGMSVRHRQFSQFLAINDNPLKSYRLAGYTLRDGVSQGAYVLAAEPRIQTAVEYWKEVFSSASHTSPEKVLLNLSYMANVDVTSYYNADWTIKAPDELSEEQKQALTGVEVVEKGTGRTIKLKTSKLEANKILGEIHRMFEDDKSKAQGMNLTIQLGQQVNISTVPDIDNTTKDKGLTINLAHKEP